MNSPYSNEIKEFTIEPGCPWYEAQQTYGAPNVNWCEPTTCAIINEPANTWSNLPYMIVGLILIKKMRDKPINSFPWVIFFMGLFSFIYHASNNYLTQMLDFVGMFLFMSFMLAFNLKRFLPNAFSFGSAFWFFMFLNTMIFLLFGILDMPVQKIMLMNTIPIVILEFLNGYLERMLKSYRYFILALFFLITAQAAAILDIQRIYCEPDNIWLHGHVVWHLLGAVAMWFSGLHVKEVHSLTRRVLL